jgi:uncharacterized protein (TIGR02594 family)
MSVHLLLRRIATCEPLHPAKISLAAGMLFPAIAVYGLNAQARTAPAPKDEPFFGYRLTEQQAPQPEQNNRQRERRHHEAHRSHIAQAPHIAAVSNSGSSAILNEARHWVGRGNVTGTHRAWCADFANWVLTRTGHRTSGSGMVKSLLSVGPRVSTPSPGDIVVMRNHVTIFAGFGGQGFYGLGGNQHNRVAMSNYPLRSVVAYVRPN